MAGGFSLRIARAEADQAGEFVAKISAG